MQSQVRFNRVPEKVPEKVPEALVQSQVKFNRVLEFRRRCGRLWCKACARSGSTGFRRLLCKGQVQQGSGEGSGEGRGGFGAEPGQVQQDLRPLTHGNPAEVFPGLGFAARF